MLPGGSLKWLLYHDMQADRKQQTMVVICKITTIKLTDLDIVPFYIS